MKNYIITTALPYANGNLHIGHFFEATIADIKVRYLQSQNKNPIFISGDDSHGAATTLYCHKNNLNIEEHLLSQYKQHKETYNSLKINFSLFSKTNTNLHHKVVNWCIENILEYEKNNNISLLETRKVLSWFDAVTNQFLPDRYVKGICPHCSAEGQHPEVCEACNKHIEPSSLKQPKNVTSQNEVILKASNHITFNTIDFYKNLFNYENLYHSSIKSKILDPDLSKYDYIDISRDTPYYGIELKKEHFSNVENQCYYVWFDAPIGYLSFAFQVWLKDRVSTKILFKEFLTNIELEHFIGKDISYFHTFIWLNVLQYILSDENGIKPAPVKQLNFHGWITLNNEKLSKSKGHHFDLTRFSSEQIDALRLYFFSKQDGSIQDTEYLEKEVYEIYNQVIVGNLANFYARTIKIAEKNDLLNHIVWDNSVSTKIEYQELIEKCNYKKLYELIKYDLAQLNSKFQQAELWKETDHKIILLTTQELLTEWYHIFKILKLVCPSLEDKQEYILNSQFIHIAERLDPFSLFD